MSLEQAVAPVAPLPQAAHSKGELSRRVRAEQLALLCRQWLRLPLPILVLCAYVAYLSWGYVALPVVIGWAALTVGVLIARSILIVALRRRGGVERDPEAWARRFTALAALSGVVSGSAALLFFEALPADRQALLTMVMCCWGAGALASSSAYPRAYLAFAAPLFAQIGFAWLHAEAPGAWFIALLLVAFLAVMLVFVREGGRVVVESIELRFANEELLAEKEELIRLLRAEYEKAQAARAKAEEASRSKSQFLASASHDLRQPLHALSLLTALLREASVDSHVREVGRHIDQSVQSLERLFGALLDLSKLDAGVVKIDLHELDLAELVEHLSDEYRSKAQEKSLAYEVSCPRLWLRTDPMQLERILRNLLENAIRFTDAGRVTLSAQRSGNDAVISVRDTGSGIPEVEHSRVFEEFYQLQNPGRDRSKGLGLGLSIVKRLVELLGYRVQLQSAPGRGSTFTVTLPGAVSEGPSVARAEPPAAAADVAGLRVLVIEDDAEARRALELTLQGWRCTPVVAASLDDALARLSEGQEIDVILSDLRLAGGASGIEAVKALRRNLGPVPAALVTGDTGEERLLELRASGLPVLHKPVKAEALRALLHRLAHRETERWPG
jgi:signal transduction histidine kinase/ActR/RegA family two-component response regulator